MDSFDVDSLFFKLAADDEAVEGEFALLDPASGLVHAGQVATGLRAIGVFRVRKPTVGADDNSTQVEVRNIPYVLAQNSATNPVTAIGTLVYVEGPTTVGSSATGASAAGRVYAIDPRGVTVKLVGF